MGSRITAADLPALYFTYFQLVLTFEKKIVQSEEGDMTCPLLLLLPTLVFAVLTSTVDVARAPEPGFSSLFGSNARQPDGFEQQQFRARRQQQQGGREKILPNPCTFQAAQCQARRTRGPPLIKDPNQDDVI